MAFYRQVNVNILDKIANKPSLPWPVFSKEEFRQAIINCNNSSTPGPDKLSWSHLKIILKDDDCLNIIISITNTCIELGYWPSHFKRSTTIVIPKPNKKSYDLSEAKHLGQLSFSIQLQTNLFILVSLVVSNSSPL